MAFSNILTASYFRSNLYRSIREIVSNSDILKVTSKGGNVVIISEEEFNSMNETLHLMKSPKNAERMQQGIDSLERGEGKVLTMDELDILIDE